MKKRLRSRVLVGKMRRRASARPQTGETDLTGLLGSKGPGDVVSRRLAPPEKAAGQGGFGE